MEKLNQNKDFLENTIQAAPDCVKPIQVKNVEGKKITYDFNGNIWNRYTNGDTYQKNFTFQLPPDKKVNAIKKITITGTAPCKVSWGNDPYYGRDIKDLLKAYDDKRFIEYATNATACKLKQVAYPTSLFELMFEKRQRGSATMRCDQQAILTWFNDGYAEYVQILYYQYGESWASSDGGGMWLYLGTGLEIEFI